MAFRHRRIEELAGTDNPTVYRRICREYTTDCSYCAPHRGFDNRWSRHARTDRYKNKTAGGRKALRSIRHQHGWSA